MESTFTLRCSIWIHTNGTPAFWILSASALSTSVPASARISQVELVHNILSQNLSADAVAKQQFFVELITSDFCKVISSRIEEHACDQALCTLSAAAGCPTEIFVQLKQTFLIALGSIFCQAGKDFRFFTEQIDDLAMVPLIAIRTVIRAPFWIQHEHRKMFGVCLVFQPYAPHTVRNSRRIQFFTHLSCAIA